jgi:hypothetical protein
MERPPRPASRGSASLCRAVAPPTHARDSPRRSIDRAARLVGDRLHRGVARDGVLAFVIVVVGVDRVAHHLRRDRDQDLVDVLEGVEPAAQRVVVVDRDVAHARERLLEVRQHARRRGDLGVEIVEIGPRDRGRDEPGG